MRCELTQMHMLMCDPYDYHVWHRTAIWGEGKAQQLILTEVKRYPCSLITENVHRWRKGENQNPWRKPRKFPIPKPKTSYSDQDLKFNAGDKCLTKKAYVPIPNHAFHLHDKIMSP